MRVIRGTMLMAVAMLIAVFSLVTTTSVDAGAHEYSGTDPGLTVTVDETEAGTILTLASVDPGLTLTVTLERGSVALEVISKEPGVNVNVNQNGQHVTLIATSADGTATLEVTATPGKVRWARSTPDYTGAGTYPP